MHLMQRVKQVYLYNIIKYQKMKKEIKQECVIMQLVKIFLDGIMII